MKGIALSPAVIEKVTAVSSVLSKI